ncbi:hypothetical protein AJ79_07107 [Helicocarpus griseus UAMH5409]|uniref:Folylpolyglutamate synthase n=1 Tax=Helicocarpus griseus UAMH5409 TaxID=1447875 RepID=A0A2B7X6G7_9EURO|nr:hypothetical protein AJ79_07107 [Helicocarpus griseus UAMH5409]
MESRTYENAIDKLNSTQTNFRALEQRRQLSALNMKLPSAPLEDMRQWLKCLGYTVSDLNGLNIVHVAGTKGKGSTCNFVNSILQQYQQQSTIGTTHAPRKIGLYTSPHIKSVRERISINSEPISEKQFAKYFFEVWDALEYAVTVIASSNTAGNDGTPQAKLLKPTYFRFLTLLSFHVFLRENVDVAIYEVGVGGERDSTNVIAQPVVTGITTLGMDHMNALGHTIDKIAWHKAGIFKTGCPAVTVQQVPEAMKVLEARSLEKGVELVTIDADWERLVANVDVRPAESFQKRNAALAVKLATVALARFGIRVNCSKDGLPMEFVKGLESARLRGRGETLTINQQNWHLDGAHTEDSIALASSWFGRVALTSLKQTPRILIFNQQSQRDATSLLRTLYHTLYHNFNAPFQHAVFCTSHTYKGGVFKSECVDNNADPTTLQSLALQKELANVWKQLDPVTRVVALPSIEDVVDYVNDISRRNGGEMQIFVVGCFRLVGGILAVLER